LETGAGGHHRRASGAHGGDDFFGVDALQVDRRRAEVGVLDMRVIWLPPAETPWQTVTGALACYAVGV
jgi:hypothetical protein